LSEIKWNENRVEQVAATNAWTTIKPSQLLSFNYPD